MRAQEANAPRAQPGTSARSVLRRRTRQKREGIVMLIVMLMLLMATGTAMFTIQSTQYEQRASTAVGEANWARGVAECTAMAGLTYAENLQGNPTQNPLPLGAQWQPSGSQRALYGRKYSLPDPINPSATNNVAGDPVTSVSLTSAPFVNNAPLGLGGFLPPARGPATALPMFQLRDDPTGATPGLRFIQSHWLQETLQPNPTTVTTPQQNRVRTVITGFAEIHVGGDSTSPGDVREIHELDAISRGYIDRFQ
jgi:hypothetical protein